MPSSRGKLFSWILSGLIVGLPLVHYFGIFNPFEVPKFLCLIIVIPALLSIRCLEYLRTSAKRVPVTNDLLVKLVVAFGLTLVVADYLGIDPRTSIFGSAIRLQGFVTWTMGMLLFTLLYVFGKTSVSERRRYEWAIRVSAISLSITAIWHGVRYYFWQDPLVPTYFGRMVATLGNPNFLGGYLAMTLPFFIPLTSSNLRLPRLTFLSLSLVAIMLSASRSAIVAVVVTLGSYAVICAWRARVDMPLHLKRWFIALVVLLDIVGGLVSLAFLYSRHLDDFSAAKYSQDIIESSYFARFSPWDNQIFVWKEAVVAILKRPFLGYGQENFALVFPRKLLAPVDNAHNIFLETALSSGLVGLSIFILILVLAFRKARMTVKLALIAFMVRAQFNPLSLSEITLFWILVGMV